MGSLEKPDPPTVPTVPVCPGCTMTQPRLDPHCGARGCGWIRCCNTKCDHVMDPSRPGWSYVPPPGAPRGSDVR